MRPLIVVIVVIIRAVLGRLSPASSSRIEAQQLTNDHNATNPVEAKGARFRFVRGKGRIKETESVGLISY